MLRVNRLLSDFDYLSYLEKNRVSETDRIYCRHDLAHALDTARIAYILSLEENDGLGKELIYAAALVHDIGRWMQYASGMPHEKASRLLAPDLLKKSGFTDTETALILEAVTGHREQGGTTPLSGLLYRADKLSRPCISCGAIKTCKRFLNNETPFLQY